jgi:hypothetical protein
MKYKEPSRGIVYIFTALGSAYHVPALCHPKKSPLSPVFYRVRFRLEIFLTITFFFGFIPSKMGWFWADTPQTSAVSVPHASSNASPPVRFAHTVQL